MFIIDCPTCQAKHLVTNIHILSLQRTDEGMIGSVRCAQGHTVVHRFAPANPNPKPPASMHPIKGRQQEPVTHHAA